MVELSEADRLRLENQDLRIERQEFEYRVTEEIDRLMKRADEAEAKLSAALAQLAAGGPPRLAASQVEEPKEDIARVDVSDVGHDRI